MQYQTFTELSEQLHKSNPKYWQILVNNSKLIMVEVANTNQGVVAKCLNIHLPKFNALIPLLREFSYADNTQLIIGVDTANTADTLVFPTIKTSAPHDLDSKVD